jgi:hypothetical protein
MRHTVPASVVQYTDVPSTAIPSPNIESRLVSRTRGEAPSFATIPSQEPPPEGSSAVK